METQWSNNLLQMLTLGSSLLFEGDGDGEREECIESNGRDVKHHRQSLLLSEYGAAAPASYSLSNGQ